MDQPVCDRMFRLLIVFVMLAIGGVRSIAAFSQTWIGQAVTSSAQCVPQAYDPKLANYESWISPYRSDGLKGGFGDHHTIQLALTVIDGDDLKSDEKFIPFCGMTTTISVSGEGSVSMQRITPLAVQGAGPGMLPENDRKTMRSLIGSLRTHTPDDNSHLPPPGRRVVLQMRQRRRVIARVYDRADLPDSISEILGLTGATHGPLAMDFHPSTIRTQEEMSEDAIAPDAIGIRRPHPRDPVTKSLRADTVTLAVSPDGSHIVTRDLFIDDRTAVIDRKTSAVYLEKPDVFSGRRSIYISHASFTPDGRSLLLSSNLPAIYIYNTQTWQQVNSLPGMPSDAVDYFPSSDWKHGVSVSAAGEATLWDSTVASKLTALDLDGELQNVSFSPDSALLAVTSVRQNQDQSSTFHLRIWETRTGHFVRELRPLYYFEHDVMGYPMWWGNGTYLFAETREGRFGSYVVGVWNVKSGKFRGGFSGCSFSDDPFDVALSDQRLFKWCRDGKLLVWDVAAAVGQIATFESSLERTHSYPLTNDTEK
jgi:WD40 repeat protein